MGSIIPSSHRRVVNKLLRLTFGAALVTALLLPGIARPGVADFIRGQAATQGREMAAAATAMPAANYRYSSGPGQMTFAELVLHVADGNYLFCAPIGSILAAPSMPKLSADGPKDALVKRLQESFDFCARALASLDDTKLSEMLTIGNTQSPRSMAILTLSGSWNSHLSMARDYLSQNGP